MQVYQLWNYQMVVALNIIGLTHTLQILGVLPYGRHVDASAATCRSRYAPTVGSGSGLVKVAAEASKAPWRLNQLSFSAIFA
ncbi:hypothetical protein BLD44_017785 [Mastigocladus laminosus UU774]|nr:hypothetical protein BLD44_017785 [Mastigocladus laminosus UU774]